MKKNFKTPEATQSSKKSATLPEQSLSYSPEDDENIPLLRDLRGNSIDSLPIADQPFLLQDSVSSATNSISTEFPLLSTKQSLFKGFTFNVRYVLLSVIFILFSLFYFAIPWGIGIVASNLDPEILKFDLAQLTDNGFKLNLELKSGIPSYLPLKTSFSTIDLYGIFEETPKKLSYIASKSKSDVPIANLNIADFSIIPGLKKITTQIIVSFNDVQHSGKYLSKLINTLGGFDDCGSKNHSRKALFPSLKNIKIYAKGKLNISIGKLGFNSVNIRKIIDIKLGNFPSLSLSGKLGPITENPYTHTVSMSYQGHIQHNLEQNSTISFPDMRFNLDYSGSQISSLKLSAIKHSRKETSFTASLNFYPTPDKTKLKQVYKTPIAIESFINKIVTPDCNTFTICGYNSGTDSLRSYNQKTSYNSLWVNNLLSNINLPISFDYAHKNIINMSYKSPITPELILNSGFLDLDSKYDDGFRVSPSGQARIRIPLKDLDVSKLSVKLLSISGNLNHNILGSSLDKTPLISPGNKNSTRYKHLKNIFNVTEFKVPVITELEKEEASFLFSSPKTPIIFNKDNKKEVESWLNEVAYSNIITGILQGDIDITLYAFGTTISIRNIKFMIPINYDFKSKSINKGIEFSPDILNPQIQSIVLKHSSQNLIKAEIEVETLSNFDFGFYLSDIATKLLYKNSTISNVFLQDTMFSKGNHTNKLLIDLPLGPKKKNLEEFIELVSSGNKTFANVKGFEGSTSVIPLDMVYKNFNHLVEFDLAQYSSKDQSRPILKNPVIKDTFVNIFSSTIQTTIINPASGIPVYVASIKGDSYFHGTLLGNVNERYVKKLPNGRFDCRNCIELFPNVETVTPKIKANLIDKTKLWQLLRDSIGGTLAVDAHIEVEILIGNDNIILLKSIRRDIPINLRL
ncbi:hypothetical protein AYI68_g4932 [Smittium mucronatum]|uniref:Tag1-like fifth Ig-like domain-containing protein n=1 Tax=Smittium mucronatum TaxID=133383 RepID=A0A1R0GVR6_9FUNG|nr:hypothetical protein AYI68_g4932 [Smittium mucronatum]